MVAHPSLYKWSSYQQNSEGSVNRIVTGHDVYQRLGMNESERVASCRKLFNHGVDHKTLLAIRNASRSSMPLGNSLF